MEDEFSKRDLLEGVRDLGLMWGLTGVLSGSIYVGVRVAGSYLDSTGDSEAYMDFSLEEGSEWGVDMGEDHYDFLLRKNSSARV